MICNTRSRVTGLTPGNPLMTREAVVSDTPASFAICSKVIVMVIPVV
jgi:hypothetical protein